MSMVQWDEKRKIYYQTTRKAVRDGVLGALIWVVVFLAVILPVTFGIISHLLYGNK